MLSSGVLPPAVRPPQFSSVQIKGGARRHARTEQGVRPPQFSSIQRFSSNPGGGGRGGTAGPSRASLRQIFSNLPKSKSDGFIGKIAYVAGYDTKLSGDITSC